MKAKITLELRSMFVGFLLALIFLIMLGPSNPHSVAKDKYQAITDNERFLILNTVSGNYIVEDDFSDRIRWYKGDFETIHKNGWDIPGD